MKTVSKATFHDNFSQCGLALDVRYQPPQTLVYPHAPDLWRHWSMPESPKDLPSWISRLVRAMHFDREIFLYPRAGAWSSGNSLKLFQLSSIFRVCGVRPMSEEVVVADLKEYDAIESVIFVSLIHGGTVADDIFLVPDHGKLVLYVDHHEAVNIDFADEQTMNDYITKIPCDDDSA